MKEMTSKTFQRVAALLDQHIEDDDIREEILNGVKTLEVQRAKKAQRVVELEGQGDDEEETEQPEKKPKVETKTEPNAEDAEWRKRMDFLTTVGRDLDATEVEEVIAYAKGKGISYEEALKSPTIATWRTSHQEQKRAEAAQVNGGEGGGKSDIEQKFTQEQLDAMPSSELEKHLPKS